MSNATLHDMGEAVFGRLLSAMVTPFDEDGGINHREVLVRIRPCDVLLTEVPKAHRDAAVCLVGDVGVLRGATPGLRLVLRVRKAGLCASGTLGTRAGVVTG